MPVEYDNDRGINYHRLEAEERRRNEERFIHSIMRRLHGKILSYNEAASIFQEIIIHMSPEEAHKLVYEVYHQAYPELSKICADRSKRWSYDEGVKINKTREFASPTYIKHPNGRLEVKMPDGESQIFHDRLMIEDMDKPKEDFLSKDDVMIK